MRALPRLLMLALCCAAAACAGSSHLRTAARRVPVAQRVCRAELHAAAAMLPGARLRIADPDPANIECVVSGDGVAADSIAQASPRAWEQYDTATVHLIQAFGAGPVHVPSELPHPVPGMSGNAAWVPAQHQLIATNGTQSSGGSYITVTVKRTSARGPSSLALARTVGRATLASAPRGPSPGVAPS